MLSFKLYLEKHVARHQGPNGLFTGFNDRPRKSLNMIAQYRKDKHLGNPNINKLQKMPGQIKCTDVDIDFIRENYPQINLIELDDKGKFLGKSNVGIKKVINSITKQEEYHLFSKLNQ